MNKKEKDSQDMSFKENTKLDLPEFYKELNKAIKTNNKQSIYGLSKVFNRYYFKKVNN